MTETDSVNPDSDPEPKPDSGEQRADSPSDSDTRAAGRGDSGGSRGARNHHAQSTAGVKDSTRGSFGSPDSMTIALTLQAGRRLESPGTAVENARMWADWIGVVGEVSTQRLKEFCDEFSLNPDFINGTGTNPTERLASIGEGSMFHAERTVVVGTPDERSLAVTAGWEFIPITKAASKAAWELRSK